MAKFGSFSINADGWLPLRSFEGLSSSLLRWLVISDNLSVRVLLLRSSVIHGFVTEPWYSRHVLFSHKRACWSVVFGSRHSGFRHSCSTFCLIVWVCGLEFARPHALLCVLLCCTQFVFFIGCVHSCYILCCVARSLGIHWMHVVMSCVNEHVAYKYSH